MELWHITDRIREEVHSYCLSKGYQEGNGVNNFVPHDSVAAFQMAKLLTQQEPFEHYISIAPEGYIYSYFFERLGARILSIYTNYPPTRVETKDDLGVIKDAKVLLIEDDIIGGATLRLVVKHLLGYQPQSISLYLGHTKGIQHIQNVPPEITKTFLAEDCLPHSQRLQHEAELIEFFST